MKPGGRKIDIQRKMRTADGQGGFVESYGHSAYARGFIRPAGGSDLLLASQRSANVTHVALIYGSISVKVADRMVLDSREYEVLYAVNPGGLNRDTKVSLNELQRG